MNQNIKTVNVPALLNSDFVLGEGMYSKFIEKMKNDFSEEHRKWYMYLNYHPTNDFPIDLENVWKMLGFAHKGNAKRTLENIFVKEEYFQCLLIPRNK